MALLEKDDAEERAAEERRKQQQKGLADFIARLKAQEGGPSASTKPKEGAKPLLPPKEEKPVIRTQRAAGGLARERERGMAQYKASERADYSKARDTSKPLLSYLDEAQDRPQIGLAEPERPDTSTPEVTQTRREWDTVRLEEPEPDRDVLPFGPKRREEIWQAPPLGGKPLLTATPAANLLTAAPAVGNALETSWGLLREQGVGDSVNRLLDPLFQWRNRLFPALGEASEEIKQGQAERAAYLAQQPAAQEAEQRSADRLRQWSEDGELSRWDVLGDRALRWVDRIFTQPVQYIGTTPLAEQAQAFTGDYNGDISVAPAWAQRRPLEYLQPIGSTLNRGLNPLNPNFVPLEQRGLDTNQPVWSLNNLRADLDWYAKEIQKGVARWDATTRYIDSLPPAQQEVARRGLINMASGPERTQRSIEYMLNSEQRVNQLLADAARAEQEGDRVAQQKLLLEAYKLQEGSWVDITDEQANPWARFVYEALFDPTNLMGGIFKLAGGTPMQIAKLVKANKLYRITDEQAVAQIAKQMAKAPEVTRIIGGEAKPAANNILGLFKRTNESNALMQAQRMYEMAVNAFLPISSKEDAARVLVSLGQDGGQSLIRGLGGLQSPAIADGMGGFYRWGPGLVGNAETAKTAPLWGALLDEIPGMRSLQEEAFNTTDFLAELGEMIYRTTRRANGIADPSTLPFGASKIRAKKVNASTGVLEYLDDKGKVIRTGGQMPLTQAQKAAKDFANPRRGFNPITASAAVQKAIMSDMFLALRPANWIRNAASATAMLVSEDALTMIPNRQIHAELAQRFGGTLPWLDTNATRETGSGAIDWLARKVSGKPDNMASNIMKWFYDRPYGEGVGGEGWFRLKAKYKSFNRAFEPAWKNTVQRTIAPRIREAGVPDELAREIVEQIKTLGLSGNREEIALKVREIVGKRTVPIDVRGAFALGTDDLPVTGLRRLQEIANTFGPERIDEAVAEITKIVDEARQPYLSVLSEALVQPVVRYTNTVVKEEMALVRDMLADMGKRAGVPEPKKTAEEIAKAAIVGTQEQWARMLNDVRALPSDERTAAVLNDYFATLQDLRAETRKVVDELGRRAIGATPQERTLYWRQKFEGTADAYKTLTRRIGEVTDESRATLMRLAGDPNLEYTSTRNWDEMLRRYMAFDERMYQTMRAVGDTLGGVRETPSTYEAVINSFRGKVDQSFMVLLDAVKRYPTPDNFDLLAHAMSMADNYGRRVAATLQKASTQVGKELSQEGYYRQRNTAWRMQWLDNVLKNNEATLRQMVENGLSRGTDVPSKQAVQNAAEQVKQAAPAPRRGTAPYTSPTLTATPARPRVWGQGADQAADMIDSLKAARLSMRAEWDRVARGELGLGSLDSYIRTYTRNGQINMNAATRDSSRVFEDLYGKTIAGHRIENLDDVWRFFAEYGGMQRQIERAAQPVAEAKELAKLNPAQIVDRVGHEFLDAGFSPSELEQLKRRPRAEVLDLLASIRGDEAPAPTIRGVQPSTKKPYTTPSGRPLTPDEAAKRGVDEVGTVAKVPETLHPHFRPAGSQVDSGYSNWQLWHVTTNKRGLAREGYTPAKEGVGMSATKPGTAWASADPKTRDRIYRTLMDLRQRWLQLGKPSKLDFWRAMEKHSDDELYKRAMEMGIAGDPSQWEDIGVLRVVVNEDIWPFPSGNAQRGTIYGDLNPTKFDFGVQQSVEIPIEKIGDTVFFVDDTPAPKSTYTQPTLADKGKYDLAPEPFGPEPAPNILGIDVEEGVDVVDALKGALASHDGMPTLDVGDTAETMLRHLDELESKLKAALPDLLAGKPNTLTPAQQLRIVDVVDNALPLYDDTLAQAMRVADDMAGWMMLNFNDKRNIDTILGVLSPFPYFWSRMLPRAVGAALTKPSLVNKYYDAKRAIAQENQQAGIPETRYGTVPNPIPIGPNRIGLGTFLDAVIPGVMYLNPNPFVEPDEASNDTGRWILNVLRFTAGLLPANQYALNAILDRTSPRQDGLSWNQSFQLSDIFPVWKMVYYNQMRRKGFVPDSGMWHESGPLSGGDEFDYGRIGKGVELAGQQLTGAQRLWGQDVVRQGKTGEEPLPEQWEGAEGLAQQGAQRAGGERLGSLLFSYFFGMPAWNDTPEERTAREAQELRRFAGYDPVRNPQGSKAAVDAVDEATNDIGKTYSMYSSLYPQAQAVPQAPGGQVTQAERSPAPPTYPYRQPFSNERQGIAAARDERSGETDAVYEQYAPQIDTLNQEIDSLTADIASLTEQINATPKGDARDPLYQERDALYDRKEAADKERSALYDTRDAKIAEIKGNYPSVVDTQQQEEFNANAPTGADPTSGTQPQGNIDYYGSYSPEELADVAARNAERMAKEKYKEQEPNWDNKPVYPDPPGDGAGKAEWDAWRTARDAYQAEADAFYGAVDEYERLVQEETDRLMQNPSGLVYGRPTRGLPTGAKAAAVQVAAAKDKEDQAIEEAQKRERVAGGSGGAGGGGGSAWQANWDAYHALGNSDDKAAYLLANPDFADEYFRYAKSKDPDAVRWWENRAAGGRGTKGDYASGGRYFKGDSQGRSWGEYWDEYRALGNSQEKAAYLRAHPEFADYYATNYSEGERWWESSSGGGTGGSSFRSYSYGGYGGGGGWGGGGADENEELRMDVRVSPREYNYNLMPQGRNIDPWRPLDSILAWLQAGANLRPQELGRWRIRG